MDNGILLLYLREAAIISRQDCLTDNCNLSCTQLSSIRLASRFQRVNVRSEDASDAGTMFPRRKVVKTRVDEGAAAAAASAKAWIRDQSFVRTSYTARRFATTFYTKAKSYHN